MAFRQYTQCYNHTPGDKPFNESDLFAFAAGVSAPGLIGAIFALLTGANVAAAIIIAIQYAVTITAIANAWLFHRLVCVSGNQCAVGTVHEPPSISPLLGAFDNDQFFDIRLLPHRPEDEYKGPDTQYNAPTPGPGPSQDGKTELTPQNDIYLDNFQGQQLLRPVIADLPYDTSRSTLHCEAEGNFWQAMKDTAALQAVLVGGGAAAGAAAGAALGCAIGGLFGPLGCLIGAIIGAIAGAFAGAAAGAYVGASIAFNSDPGDVNDANVGDQPLGGLNPGDQVVVFGTHVYDGFHEGWHEIHPLMAIIKAGDPKLAHTLPYVEWNPDFPAGGTPPAGLSVTDMREGLASSAFTTAAHAVRDQWCGLLTEAFDPGTRTTQQEPPNRWTVHPDVDGCDPDSPPPPPR